MGDLMRPVPLLALIARIFEEYVAEQAIFGYPASQFFRKQSDKQISLLGETVATAVGPAAGPHTQLAQNIVVSYLAGARFIELKTVQEQEPPVAKPCIDAEDEGFNTEWSSEYTVEKACEEYIKAWVLLHVLEETLGLSNGGKRSFIFNMSAGYNLAGIQSPRMDAYLNNMMDASTQPYFTQCLAEIEALIDDGSFLNGTGLEGRLPALKGLPKRISGNICQSITLSTMHGCPPEEIEKICVYLLTEKKLNMYVKLNPTLLTYQGVRSILDSTGFHYIELSADAFAHDLQYTEAMPMLTRLKQLADKQGRFFGIKLTNTLGIVNTKGKLPGGEMYLSGRALFPLAITLAAKISAECNGLLPISFSGGISEHNVLDVFAAGIKPITMATELLKPGGYVRLAAVAAKLETADGWEAQTIDAVRLQVLAQAALTADYSQKKFREKGKALINSPLPLFDCAVAPCQAACPIHQDIPEYIRLAGQKQYAAALALIYEKNALPGITGAICEHVCQYHCTRLDYEGCVRIREVKRLAVEQGWEEYRQQYSLSRQTNGIKAAVMGAGPAGLAVAYFLARQGFGVTVYETRESVESALRQIMRQHHISREIIAQDIEFITAQGVEFVFNSSPALTPAALTQQGYHYVVANAAGEESGNGSQQLINQERVYLTGVRPGASSIVRCIADGRRVADEICRQALPGFTVQAEKPVKAQAEQAGAIAARKFGLKAVSALAVAGAKVAMATGEQEAGRCLECNYICNKCVEVCPNRANLAVCCQAGLDNYSQIIHLDAFCNECGNCATFCPWKGRPFADKLTLFSRRDDFLKSHNSGFFVDDETVYLRVNGEVMTKPLANNQLALTGDQVVDQLIRVFNELYVGRPMLFGPVAE